MNKEDIVKSWRKYIDDLFVYSSSPYLFERPSCATCTHWNLLTEEDLREISITSPVEYETMCLGIEGSIPKYFREEGEVRDVYSDHLFHGHCMRYPPVPVDSDSIIKYRFPFSFMNVKIHKYIARFAYPIVSHELRCGEWKQHEWVSSFLSKQNNVKKAE